MKRNKIAPSVDFCKNPEWRPDAWHVKLKPSFQALTDRPIGMLVTCYARDTSAIPYDSRYCSTLFAFIWGKPTTTRENIVMMPGRTNHRRSFGTSSQTCFLHRWTMRWDPSSLSRRGESISMLCYGEKGIMCFWGRWIYWDSDCIGLMMELSSNDNSELSKNNPTNAGEQNVLQLLHRFLYTTHKL